MAVIESPMAGKILEILVVEEKSVSEEDAVIIRQAIKMENPVYASENGVIKEIKVQVGQHVAEGDVLVVLE